MHGGIDPETGTGIRLPCGDAQPRVLGGQCARPRPVLARPFFFLKLIIYLPSGSFLAATR